MKRSFDQLLKQLSDDSQPFPSDRLSELSDLDEKQLERLQTYWSCFSSQRKRTLLEDLGQQARHRFELTFDAINRLALTDSDSQVRRLSIQNLWECEEPDLVSHFMTALCDDPSSSVRSAAATALGLFVWLGEIEQLAEDLLHQLEEGLIKAQADDESPDVRRFALESLGFSSRPEVPPLIKQAYEAKDEALLQSALFAMGRSASEEWEPYVLPELTNASPKIRLEAAKAAGELGLQEALDPLIELLDDVNDDVRDTAIWSLGQIGGEDASDALLILLESVEDEELVEYIEKALDHLAFVDGTRDFLLIDFDEPEEPAP
jgi:HEAT repeat protein